jgi:hypothetical protein
LGNVPEFIFFILSTIKQAVYGCLNLFKRLFMCYFLLFKRLFAWAERFIKTVFSYIIMFNWLFKKEDKQEFEQHKGAVQTALNNVKQDMANIGKWIKHLDSQDSSIKNDMEAVMGELASIREELSDIKDLVEEQNAEKAEPVFKQRQTAVVKQTPVYDVQTAVQTTVQAAFFTKLSVSEKAIVGMLLNVHDDMKLSYEDLAAMTGKDTATVRGQVNSIRQKCDGIIEEQIEKNGKKRLYVPENIKDLLLRKAKNSKKRRKIEENPTYSA